MDGFCYRYALFFGPHRVGDVIQGDVDYPDLRGTITYDPALWKPHSAEVARLVKFLSLDRDSSPPPDAEAVAESFEDMIGSEDWHLVDEQGRWSPISCPLLWGERSILWRWAAIAEDADSLKM